MKTKKNNCPNCGANIVIPNNITDATTYTCPYCSTLLDFERDYSSTLNDHSSYLWKITVHNDSSIIKKKTTRIQLVILIFAIFVPLFIIVGFFAKNTSIDFISSGAFNCSGNDHLSLLNKKISSINASANCRVILNDVKIISKSTAINAKDNARITILNSTINAKKSAIMVEDNVKISIMNSTVLSKDTAFNIKGKSSLRLINSSANGKINLYKKDKSSQISIINSSTTGNKIEK